MDSDHIARHMKGTVQAMKTIEMTVLRGIKMIEMFDEIVEELRHGHAWGKAPTAYRPETTDMLSLLQTKPKSKVQDLFGGAAYQFPLTVEVLWDRYLSKGLHQEVLDLAENVDESKLSKARRKELKRGLTKIRAELDR